MLAHTLVSSFVVHTFAFLAFLVVPVAAHLLANDSRPLRTLPSFSQPMTEHGMTHSHTFRFAVALGVACLIYSARALRRAACVSAESLPESITTLVTAAGFTNVNIQPIKFESTDDLSRFLRFMKQTFTAVLAGEAGEQYETYMKEKYGEGDFTLTWEALVVTAEKP
ncbi:hypothetical protein C8R45DRAFT_1094460 [Mycena sanguinolenta]|nr:hypothetical protein C8R45DRAFT_1094460 [Mycena sanguinolenta]